ncbi:MAG TPA: sensor histidine kinase [Ktedonobacteraceae bacterium]|jgi:signal transduction histidine kinase|nr:sensor histidine kinase [Ktedonobacteraceae bacterium]
MHRLAEFYETYIFETVSKEERTLGNARWWSGMQRRRHVPYAFSRGVLLTTDAVLLLVVGVLGFTTYAPIITVVGRDLLYLGTFALLLLARICKRFVSVVGCYLAVFGLGIVLDLVFPGMWGNAYFYMLCITVLYRFPPRWALPFAVSCILALITTNKALQLLPFPSSDNGWALLLPLAIGCGLCWIGSARRTQFMLVMQLHEVQALLREQMVRGEELAVERERTRIARDIHDVLSHSLAVLSIQVQAARNLRTRNPERLAAKLDDMATIIRESITESRRVVGLLREKPLLPSAQDDLGASLRFIATTFNERTGIHCRFEESGIPYKVNPQQRETLELALREMLTNAHRHGAAQTVWIILRWREARIVLETQDDGVGADLIQQSTLARDEMSNGGSGHHGLQGMRERAAALGGEVEAGPAESGGFMVSLKIPRDQSSEKAARRGKEA